MDFPSERFRSERFVKERDSWIQNPVPDDGFLRVPRHVDYLQRRPSLDQPSGQLRSAPTRHHDIGQEHGNRRVPFEQPKRFVRVRRKQYRIALPLQESLLPQSFQQCFRAYESWILPLTPLE
jgi:hypothetical protein